jgi:hypothetical protein
MTINDLQTILQNQINSTGQVIINDATLETSWLDQLLQEILNAAAITVTTPSLSTPTSDSIVLGGFVSLFGIDDISVSVTFTVAGGAVTFTLQATFPGTASFGLSDVATQIFGKAFSVPQNLASFSFSDLSLTLDTSARTIKLGGQASAQLDILGDGKFLINKANLDVTATYPAGGSMSADASLAGPMTIVGAEFDVTAEVGDGMSFTAKQEDGQSISLKALANDLISSGINLPFPDISISGLGAAFNTSDGTYSFQVQTAFDWTIPVGSPSIQAQATVKVNGSASKAATGTLDGTLVIGPATFTLSYTLAPDSNVITGSWASNGKSLGYLSLANALGISASDIQLPSGLPDLGLKSATLTIDFTKDTFILSADSTTYGEAFFVASDNGGWGFALGIALPDPWQFGSLPDPVGSDLSALDFLVFKNAYFIISSLNSPGFSFADFPPLANSKVSLVPGLTFGSEVDLSGAGSGTITANLQTILGQDTLTVQAIIGTNASQTQLSVALSGQPIPILPFQNLTLDNPQLVIAASPLSVSFDGTFALPLDGQPIDVGTTLEISTGGATFSADVTAPGGITAPFGFTGVSLEEVGLTGGLAFEPPGVTIGMSGVFKIGSNPADSFAIVLVLEGEVINPVLLYGNFNQIAFAPIFKAVFGSSVTLPTELQGINLEKLYICWAEPGQTNKLPDGSTPPAGFGLNGLLDVTSNFQAQMSLLVSLSTTDPNVSGSAEMSPIEIGNGALSVTGKSSLGGPQVQFSTNTSPYLGVTLDATLLKIASVDLSVQVSDSGFTFDLNFTVAGQAQHFACTLVDSQSFNASTSLNFPFVVNIGPIIAPHTNINLGTVNVNEQFSGNATVAISATSISGSIGGSFGHWNLPTITLNNAVTDLSDMFSMIVAQIEANAQSVFSDLFANATAWLQAVKSGLISGVGDIVAIGNVLVNFFGETIPQAATLVYNNFTNDLSQLVQLLYGLGASSSDAYSILVGLGYSASDVAQAVASVFHTHVDTEPVGHVDASPVHGDTSGPHGDIHGDASKWGVHADTGHADGTPHVDGTTPHVDTGHIDVTS